MKKYVCDICDYEYDPAEGDPDNGIDAGTAFEDLPEDWVCPLCGASKDDFSPVDQQFTKFLSLSLQGPCCFGCMDFFFAQLTT